MATTTGNAGAAGDPILYDYLPFDTGTGTVPTWGTTTVTPPTPDCKEAITILEEAEYELKELLKKTPATVSIGKSPQDQIVIALRSTQAALRALLKI